MSAITEAAALEVAKKKLAGICDKNGMTYRLYMNTYPIHMEINPIGDMDDQLSMLENAEDGNYNSPDATMVVSVVDGKVMSKTSGLFVIDKALRNRLENQFAKIHFLYLQIFHRDVIERGLLNGPYIPSSSETDSNERETEPLEVVEMPEPVGMDGEMPDYDEVGLDFPEDMMEEDDG